VALNIAEAASVSISPSTSVCREEGSHERSAIVILIVETEIWPNFLRTARRLGIPAVMVNGGYRTVRSRATFVSVGFSERF